jgi:O-antigen ligase
MLFVFVLPFSKAFPNLVLIPIAILFIVLKKYNNINFTKKDSFVFFISAVVWISFSSLLQNGIEESLKILTKFYMLIGIFFVSRSINQDSLKVIFAFIAGVIVKFIISTYGIFNYFFENGFVKLAIGKDVNSILNAERPYLGFTLALSVHLSLYLIRELKQKWLYAWVTIAITYVFFISARLATLLCILLLVYHLYIILKNQRIYLLLSVLVLSLVVIVSLFFNDNFQKRMRIDKDLKSSFAKFKAYEPRFIIWECATELIQQINPFIGVGNYQKLRAHQTNCYTSKIPQRQSSKIKFYKEKSFNTHNQFLGFLLLGGWLACLLLLGFFLSSFYNSIHSVYSIILFLFLLFFFFENVLYRQLGVQLMGFFLGFLSSKSNLIHGKKEN